MMVGFFEHVSGDVFFVGYFIIGTPRNNIYVKTLFLYYYLFDDEKVEQIRKVAEVCYPTKKRSLEVLTTEPGMLFYTAKYTSDKLCRESGERYGKFCAFCCETHRIPNGPNLCGAPDVFLSVEKPFESETIFRFIF